ncbi:hypothetical protein F511_22142 [Dorcoceras hygrometricum]|uniref:Uncharacterized protein n=1 Tax=Dorcoceras hygrometricum TaxID=472368 RepID=A0A2Z7BBM9_9LAMI|nr:hypothetical protein F511_22142 [Dorcoceras hygrometricum]
MRAIKDRIARPAYRLANHLKRASIPRTANQPISPGTYNLKYSLTGHGNSAVSLLEVQIQKLTLTEERSGKISPKASNEQALHVSSIHDSSLQIDINSAPPADTKPMRNNHQLVTLDNSKRRRNKVPVNKERRRFIISDWFFNPTAGHSAGTISHNATADSATTA